MITPAPLGSAQSTPAPTPPAPTPPAKPRRGLRRLFGRPLRYDRRGSVGLLAAMMFSILMGIGAWSINEAHLHYRGLLLRTTVQAASLAAAAKMSTYYSSGTNSTAAIVTAAQTIAAANMPLASYGSVLPASNIELGNWNTTNSTFTSLATSGGTSPNAVRITGLSTESNGNPVSLLFSGIVGRTVMNYQAQSIASYGTGQTWNTIITNDLSGSFAPSIASQRAADLAILDCVRTSAGAASQFGITTHTASSQIFQALSQAGTNYASLAAKIATLNSCGGAGAPACGSGTNVASALYSVRQQFANPAYNGTKKNMVIITDGVPNATNRTYTRADGIYPTDSSATPTCTTACTDNNLWTMATNQAALARAEGISVSTIYYSGGTPAAQRATYSNWLATLTGGTGVSMVAPTSGAISGVFAGFCSTMSSALKAIY